MMTTIPSTFPDYMYGHRDFWTAMAFVRACQMHRIPVDVPIPNEAVLLAQRAFCEGRPAIWEQARQALVEKREAA